ncbi:MAG: ABC transporter ATP-binding protein [Anaerolineae bacterium]|nr:ABC transporter ATP-binding protein [Anaerolineae bacterium]
MALTIRRLRKGFGAQMALQDIDLTLGDGVVALLGANGSGKSTLLRTLATLSRPDAGGITLDGWHYGAHERELRTQIGYLPQDFTLPDDLTPRRLLTYLATLRGAQAERLLTWLAFGPLVDQPVRTLSYGQLRLLGVAQAFLGSPRLLLLDELTRGLDFVERQRAFRLVTRYSQLAIFSTHIPEDAESLAETIIVLDAGRVLFCGALDAFRMLAEGCVHEVRAAASDGARLAASCLTSRVTPQGEHVALRVVGKAPSREALPVAPTAADAYLWLTRANRNP